MIAVQKGTTAAVCCCVCEIVAFHRGICTFGALFDMCLSDSDSSSGVTRTQGGVKSKASVGMLKLLIKI